MDSYSGNIIKLYDDYINWSNELLGSFGGVQMFAQLFTGGAEYNKREEHSAFFSACGEAAGAYLAALGEGEAPREELMPLLSYVLIRCHSGGDDWAEWMLLAAEKHFLPFIELLTKEEAAELYEPYRKLRRRNKGLPPQDEMLKKLKIKRK